MNQWHHFLYNKESALRSIHSKVALKRAKTEVTEIVKFLNLNNKKHKILDIPCGTGRHSIEFKKKKFNVIGIDINKDLLSVARSYANKKSLTIPFKYGNMSDLRKFKKCSDLTVNLFSSIGYFENDQKNEKIISELLNTLKPGGTLVLDIRNVNHLKQIYATSGWRKDKNHIISEVRSFDPKTKYNEGIQSFVDLRTGKVESHYHRLRLYSRSEITKILYKKGAKKVKVYSQFSGDPFDAKKSPRMIIYASK